VTHARLGDRPAAIVAVEEARRIAESTAAVRLTNDVEQLARKLGL
jgi:hypothetical protein